MYACHDMIIEHNTPQLKDKCPTCDATLKLMTSLMQMNPEESNRCPRCKTRFRYDTQHDKFVILLDDSEDEEEENDKPLPRRPTLKPDKTIKNFNVGDAVRVRHNMTVCRHHVGMSLHYVVMTI